MWCGRMRKIIASIEKALSPKTKAIFIESIANPGGRITDIAAVAKIARKAGVPLIVDNTLATPYLCKPFEHGANIVVHSLTKFMGGHGNSMGGVIVDGGNFDWSKSGRYPLLSEPNDSYHGIKLHETFGNIAFAIACRVLGLRDLGPAIAPLNAFLILTGMETLSLRMQQALRQRAEGRRVAEAASQGRLGKLCRPGRRQASRAAPEILPEGRGCGASPSASRAAMRRASRSSRSVKLFSHLANVGDTRSLDHPSGLDHPQPADRPSS